MSQDYFYAVQRAELLGQIPPSEEEWAASNVNVEIKEGDADDNVAQDLDQADDTVVGIGGGLDELNSILSATQRKINRFKTVCGSLGSLLKVRVTSRDNTPDHKPIVQVHDAQDNYQNFHDQCITIETSNAAEAAEAAEDSQPCIFEPPPVTHKKIDINEKMSSHLDKLDSLITKAERAQGSMHHQTQQMKKIITK